MANRKKKEHGRTTSGRHTSLLSYTPQLRKESLTILGAKGAVEHSVTEQSFTRRVDLLD